MGFPLSDWLAMLENKSKMEAPCATLWPRTPVLNIQAEIWRRMGASDYNLDHPDSRAGNIVRMLKDMQANDLLPQMPTVLDIFCGDGVILWQVQRLLGRAQCFGIDVREYPEHELAQNAGVQFFYFPAQTLISHDPPGRFDVVFMLNTFRGWDKADLPQNDRDLSQRLLSWIIHNVRYCIVTATQEQIVALREQGWWTFCIGRGEDDTQLTGMFLGRET